MLDSTAFQSPVTGCLPFLLAGGQGSRLHELTSTECKPAVPFAGAGRIVDFVMGLVAKAQFDRMVVATQYRPETLSRHLTDTWHGNFENGVHLRDGAQVAPKNGGYRGTADAVAANMAEIDSIAPREIMVLAGDHVFDMDLQQMLAKHRETGALATVAATPVPRAQASAFGVLDADQAGKVTAFVEKPANPPAMIGDENRALASMGIYVFDWQWLRKALMDDLRDDASAHDFGHNIMPRAMDEGSLYLHALPDRADGQPSYWRDVGTLDAYRLSQLDFLGGEPPISCPRRAAIAPQLADESSVALPGARVGKNCRISNAILGPGVALPDNTVIGEDPDEDARWFRRTDQGTVLVTQDMLAQREDKRAVFHPVM